MEVHLIVNSFIFNLPPTRVFQPVYSMILARITQTMVNVGAYFHVRVFKSYIYRQHSYCFYRIQSIRRTAIKIHI